LILSGDLPSYQKASHGFKENFGKPFKEYVLPKSETSRELMERVQAQDPSVIVTVGSKAAAEVLKHFPKTPVIYCMVVNPERQGLLSRKKVYGIGFTVKESVLFSKYKTALPGLKRLGVIVDKASDEKWLDEISEQARSMGLEIIAEKAASSSDIPNIMRSLSGKIDAFWMTTDSVVTSKFAFHTISNFCLDSKIPLLVPVGSLVGAGGLLSVTSSEFEIGAEAAALSAKLLAGQVPAAPLTQPSQIDITVSLKIANAMGIQIPESILRAAVIIQ
ncbi:MAG: hypothetical protein A2901_06595, partial [Elusimicrobia bacterium RIFCSPLOWO2_01_FULL_54_10]